MVITSGFGFRPLGKDSKSTVDGEYLRAFNWPNTLKHL